MKSNRGITLTSLVIYIIGLLMIIAIMANFTGYFYKNLKEVTINQSAEEQYSKFLSYITKDVNSNNLTYVQSGIDSKDCIIFKFSDGTEHQYIVHEENIYYINVENQNEKKVTLCEKVSTSAASTFSYNNNKIYVNFNIGDENFSTTLNVNI